MLKCAESDSVDKAVTCSADSSKECTHTDTFHTCYIATLIQVKETRCTCTWL